MARRKMTCSKPHGGVKTCNIGGRTVRLHETATAGTKAKRRAAAKRLKAYRFTKADARACRQSNRKARGQCMGKRVKTRAR